MQHTWNNLIQWITKNTISYRINYKLTDEAHSSERIFPSCTPPFWTGLDWTAQCTVYMASEQLTTTNKTWITHYCHPFDNIQYRIVYDSMFHFVLLKLIAWNCSASNLYTWMVSVIMHETYWTDLLRCTPQTHVHFKDSKCIAIAWRMDRLSVDSVSSIYWKPFKKNRTYPRWNMHLKSHAFGTDDDIKI